jgi:hypothetical protein
MLTYMERETFGFPCIKAHFIGGKKISYLLPKTILGWSELEDFVGGEIREGILSVTADNEIKRNKCLQVWERM